MEFSAARRGATSWGLSGTCSEALFSQYPVDTTWVTAVRMTSAGIILLFLAFAKHSLNLKELGKDKKGLIEIVLFAIAGLALCQYAYLSAIKWTNSGTATVIQNLSIVFIAVYVCLTTRTAPDKRTVFCIILALFGVWLPPPAESPETWSSHREDSSGDSWPESARQATPCFPEHR